MISKQFTIMNPKPNFYKFQEAFKWVEDAWVKA
jgi:hypothetical protein